MKARNFRYIRPASLDHAYCILAENEGDAVPIPLAMATSPPAAPGASLPDASMSPKTGRADTESIA